MAFRAGKMMPAILLALFTLFIGLVFTHSPGTTDMAIWRSWLNSANVYGLAAGYAGIQADYPPLAITILYAVNRALQPLHVGSFLIIKYSILFFLLATTLVFWRWTRDLKISLLLFFTLLLNSAALGYIDIYVAPGLALSLWALKERRWAWFSLLFTLTCLTKWQPAIIAPFIGVYILGAAGAHEPRGVDWKRLLPRLVRLVLPAAALLALAVALFGARPIWLALRASLSHEYLSGNALNLNWITTHVLHVVDPNRYGGLQNGLSSYIVTGEPRITLAPRLLFAAFYLFALALFARREKTFANLLVFATLGFLSYYTFNTGVHENHLFVPAVLAVVLFWLEEEWRVSAAILLLMNNVNLFLFYGVDGELHFPRLFAGIDMALPLAAFNLVFFFALLATVMAQRRDEKASQTKPISNGDKNG